MTLTADQVHPAADVWPMMSDDALQALADDIAENGLQRPIVVDSDGRILDGRNRHAACLIAGVEPTFETYDGDPVAYVLSANTHRRHMSTGALAMATAVVLADAGHRANGRWKYGSLNSQDFGNSTSWPEAVRRAGAIVDHARDLAADVINGRVSLNDAHGQAKRRREDAESHDARLSKLAADHPDLAARVGSDIDAMTLAEAEGAARARVDEWGQVMRAGERAVKRLAESLTNDVTEVLVAVLAARNAKHEWQTPADIDIAQLIDGIHAAASRLEECQ